MLATRPALLAAAAAVVFVSGFTANGFGQQPTPPSRTTSPAAFGPPNVHVPNQRQQMFTPPSDRNASANTSRNPSARQRTGAAFQPPRFDQAVQPTAFQEPSGGGNQNPQAPYSPFPKNAGQPPLPTGVPTGPGPAMNSPLQMPAAMPGPPKFTLPQAELPPAGSGPNLNAAGNAIKPQERVASKEPVTNSVPPASAATNGAKPVEPTGGLVVPADISSAPVAGAARGVAPTGFLAGKSENNGVGSALTASNAPPADNRFSLTSPAVQVETFGPQSIGINKKSQFKIVARNNSNVDAERVTVSISMPTWVRLEGINATTGRKESGEDQKSSRVLWNIDRLSGNSTQTITVDVVPTKAERFDLQVELIQQPRNGMAQVDVTEPRLEMKIVGPSEVLYGETAIYQVTVRNPGTGRAEGVSVMLPEALGGERATLGDIGPNEEKNFRVELLARTAGALDLATTATAAGNLQTSSAKQILVRRAALTTTIKGPPAKYAGTVGVYEIEIRNTGDASARDVVAALALPTGVKYVEGIEAVDNIDSGLRWSLGTLDSGDFRNYRVALQLEGDGKVQFELGARAAGDIASVGQVATVIETLEDVVLSIDEPKGPQPTGEEIEYTIHVRNRGSRAANNLNLVMNFSDGIEPTNASGHQFQLGAGQVIFKAIEKIAAGEEVVVKVQAKAAAPGTHIFRAQLTGENEETREMSEGTTRFYGDQTSSQPAPAKSPAPPANSSSFGGNSSGAFRGGR
ncbi:MAG: hypothetical protein ACKO81_01170 [Planctomycetota bacterium]